MILMDHHVHSDFSPDGHSSLEEMCAAAYAAGCRYMAMTDHIDIDPAYEGENGEFVISDIPAYVKEIERVKALFPGMSIVRGAELGYSRTCWGRVLEKRRQIDTQFAIGSVHAVDGKDPYFKEYFEGRNREQAYGLYLKEACRAVEAFEGVCQVVGHLNYVCKTDCAGYGELKYDDMPQLWDELLGRIVECGLGIELNTSGYRTVGAPLPGFEVVRRFYQLGGRIITFGSDAHYADRVCERISDAMQLAKSAGFKVMSVWTDEGRQEVPIEL